MQFAVPTVLFLFSLVILDYSTLNTDRGLDNFTIKCCDIGHEKAPIDTPPVKASHVGTPQMSEIRELNPVKSAIVPPTATSSMSALGG